MHIEDWNDDFLSQLDVESYVSLLKKARVQTAMVYAKSHVGLCYWPTESGTMHRGLKGKDFLGQMIDRCRDERISVVVYFSLIFDNYAYEKNEAWRILDENGHPTRDTGSNGIWGRLRYGTCCPNNEDYRKYVFEQLKELYTKYTFEGFFLDMTFWPFVCFCPSCRERYQKEAGGEMPQILNWDDPKWTAFQKKREEWIVEFANTITSFIKSRMPQLTVEHNFSSALCEWDRAVTENLTDACDYAGGDLYGGFIEQSFACKLYHNLTVNEPFEYMTSRSDPTLSFHTTTKSQQNLELHNYIALAHNGAFLFIDAIDPVGSLQSGLYDTMGGIFSKSMLYEPFLGGTLCRDVSVYFSLHSNYEPKCNGKSTNDWSRGMPHLNASLGAAKNLRDHNVLYDVICKKNSDNLNDVKVIIMADVLAVDNDEALAITRYVKLGGNLYLSGNPHNKLLEEMLGIEFIGETEEGITYITPVKKHEHLMRGISSQSPLTVAGKQQLIKVADNDSVIATVTLPYTKPSETLKFASIHSDPPGISTNNPAVIYKNYGKGKIIWVAAPIESSESAISKAVFYNFIEELVKERLHISSNAPAPVEIVLFHQPKEKRYIIHLINEQECEPLVHACDIQITVKLGGKIPVMARLMPTEKEVTFEYENKSAHINIPKLEVYQMIAIYYE